MCYILRNKGQQHIAYIATEHWTLHIRLWNKQEIKEVKLNFVTSLLISSVASSLDNSNDSCFSHCVSDQSTRREHTSILTRNIYHYSCPRCQSVLLVVSVTTVNAFAWYFASSVIDWKSFFGGTFTKKTLNDPQWRHVYSKLLYWWTVSRILTFSSSMWNEEKKN